MISVKTLQIAVIFERDSNIQYSLGSVLARYSKSGVFKISELPNPPNSPPNVPKLSVHTKQFIINISQERFDFYLTIPSQISHEPLKVLSYAQSATDILKKEFLPCVNYLWCGVVVDFNYPYKDKTSRMNMLFDRTLKIDRNEKDVATFELKYGYKENDYFLNFILSEYQSYEIVKRLKPNEVISINDGDLMERGITIKLDINNRPAIPNQLFAEDLSEIIKLIIPLANKVLKNNNLEGIQL
jgi:hypothetical protein